MVSKKEKLIKKYEKLRKKYSLPGFEELNKEFEIEEIEDEESSFILRLVRRQITEKFSFIMKFLDSIINPSSSPYLLLIIVNSLDKESKSLANKLYIKLGQLYIESIYLDNKCVEEEDANFIKKVWNCWKDIKKDYLFLLNNIKKFINAKKDKKEKNYIS